MKARPEFTVIAGPNGAGKSRLCAYYIHCKSFDGDLLALNLRKEHPDWEERWIGGTVATTLQREKDEAIAQQRDFAFETNFSSDLILNMIREFKDAGYKITLFYFGLPSLDITFIDGTSNYGEIIAIHIKKSARHEITSHAYNWFNDYFETAFNQLAMQ